MANQKIESLHPIPPREGTLPPTILIRPLLQPAKDVSHCNLCHIAFGILLTKNHCYHCGKVFCKDCAQFSTPIPKLKITEEVRVCRPCMRTVEETGGIKHLDPKKQMEEWKNKPTSPWFPKCSKKDFSWISAKSYDPFTACYKAIP
eukprot:Phypoly_transcript_08495.p1 GENE.Phypoly_transcript_08495~~Phypoly_transcript_08495.p1  ORF type:complete len:146 (+),score=11.12 Phypoly_transcript_08495:1068-1505(+)